MNEKLERKNISFHKQFDSVFVITIAYILAYYISLYMVSVEALKQIFWRKFKLELLFSCSGVVCVCYCV